MMRHLFLIGTALALTGLAHAAEWEQPYPKLGSCSKSDNMAFFDPQYAQCMESVGDEAYCSSLYPLKPLPFDQWASTYHASINRIVEDFLGKISEENLAYRRQASGAVSCSQGGDPASPALAAIAKTLEPWKDETTTFRQSDTAPVLLEYLRVYECSMVERSLSLPLEIWREENERRSLLPGGLAKNPLFFMKIWELWSEQGETIRKEMAISRPTLERTLSFIGTVHMTRMLERDTECIQRVSLDIRNSFALSADVAACMPRIWNAKDPLRDLAPCSDGRDNDDDGKIDLGDTGCESLTDMTE